MQSDDQVLNLADAIGVLRRRWMLVAACIVGVLVLSLAWSLTRTPIYEATADVAVEPFRPAEDASLEEVILGDVTVNTERQVLTSRSVTEAVIDTLGLDDEPDALLRRVAVTVIPDTRVLRVRVTNPDAERAALIANAYTEAYLQFRQDQAVASLVAAQDNLSERQTSLRDQLDGLEQELAALPSAGADDDDPAARRALQAERDRLLSQLGQVSSQLTDAQADAQLLKGGGQVLAPARPSETPISPQPIRSAALALVVGTLLGIGLAVVRDHFDDLVRDEDDAKRAAPMLPVLGRIPTGSADQRLVTLVDGASPSAEAYRGLSASVRFLLAANQTSGLTSGTGAAGGQVVLITSPDAGDGKTSTAANLSVAAARAGLRVVLVGTDMRRPKLHRRFGMPAGAGLSDVLAAEVPIREALLDVGVEGMWVLPAGTKPPNPAELLASPRMRELLDYLRGGSDLVVLDAPPVLAVADSLEMARHVDATLVVVRANQSRRRNLQHALERLEGVGAAVSGIVVNDLNAKSAAYTYYTQSYADEEPVVDRDADAAQRRGIRVRGLDESAANGQGPGAGSALKLDDPDELFPLGHERV